MTTQGRVMHRQLCNGNKPFCAAPLGNGNLMCGLASGPWPGSRSFVHQKKHLPVNENKTFLRTMYLHSVLCRTRKNIPVVNEKKHLPIFGPFRASRISFTTRMPNHRSNSRSLKHTIPTTAIAFCSETSMGLYANRAHSPLLLSPAWSCAS